MNRKGYTIMELLAVIVIIGLLFSIAIVSYTSFINTANNRVYESYRDNMHEAAIMYFTDHLLTNGETKRLDLNTLINENRLEKIKNPKNSNDYCINNSYIDAKRVDTNGVISIEYDVCLVCDDYNNTTNSQERCNWTCVDDGTIMVGFSYRGGDVDLRVDCPASVNPDVFGDEVEVPVEEVPVETSDDSPCIKREELLGYYYSTRCGMYPASDGPYATYQEAENACNNYDFTDFMRAACGNHSYCDPAECNANKECEIGREYKIKECTKNCNTVQVASNCKKYIN